MIQAMTHVAGLDITVSGRYMRQRCAWCDHVLIDLDLSLCMVSNNEDGSPGEGPRPWPAGLLVTVDGGYSRTLEADASLPDDFCGWATLATPDDFGDKVKADPA